MNRRFSISILGLGLLIVIYVVLPLFRAGRDLKAARILRGITRASITQIERHMVKLEEKPELLNADQKTVQTLIDKVQALDDTFKEHHYVMADQAEEEAVKMSKTFWTSMITE